MYPNYYYTINITLFFMVINKVVSSECTCSRAHEQLRCSKSDVTIIEDGHHKNEKYIKIVQENGIQQLPKNAVTSVPVKRVKIDCDIQELHAKSFSNQNQLHDLDMALNAISTLPNDFFANIPTLEMFNLSYNVMKSPTLDTFYALNNIKTLDLSHNNIENLQLGVLDEMSKLEKLYLNNNNLAKLKLGVFDKLKNLIQLDLSGNNLNKLKLGLFDQSQNITNLNLSGNPFAEIPLGTYDSLKNVQTLSVSNCQIKVLTLGIFDENNNLVNLDFSKNNIESLPLGIFDRCRKLENLNLADCTIVNLTAYIFDQNPSLNKLDLSNNHLKILHHDLFKHNEALNYLNLSHNFIKELPRKLFLYTNLTVIDISYNQFSTIKPELLNIETLEKVYASNNHMYYLDDQTFATVHFPLKYLDLRNNRLVFVGKLFFEWVKNLETMEIMGNPWDCRCFGELVSMLIQNSISYTSTDYYQGNIPICVSGDLHVCNVNVNNLTHYYDIYIKSLQI